MTGSYYNEGDLDDYTKNQPLVQHLLAIGLLQIISEPDIGRCANEDAEPQEMIYFPCWIQRNNLT